MIPLWLKTGYTLFVCLLVPIYWRQYGPVNFLWFSDIALIAMVPALWWENVLLTSMMALSVVLLEIVWNVDFFTRLLTGVSVTGLSAYMFDPKIPLFVRSLSCFHIVLPVVLLWSLARLGYDPRGWLWQTLVALVVLPAVISTQQPARERQLGLRFWRETADDFARAALRLGLNGRLPAADLRADAFRVQQNFFGTLRMVVLQL